MIKISFKNYFDRNYIFNNLELLEKTLFLIEVNIYK
jgi:hypothetical protein